MSDPMAEIRASFFLECEELLEALQDGLTAMEEDRSDEETINIVFRAVHSIKGGAGAFGLETLVEFAHSYETTLDTVRSGKIVPDTSAMKLFFRAADLLGDLVRCSRDEAPENRVAIDSCLDALSLFLGASGAPDDSADEDPVDFQPMSLSFDLPAIDLPVPEGTACFEITFKPYLELFSSGNEPLHILKALREIGDAQVTCLVKDLPSLAELDAEGAHIGWHILLATEQDEEAIRDIFDFVEDLCELQITQSPDSTAGEVASEAPEFPDQGTSLSEQPGLAAEQFHQSVPPEDGAVIAPQPPETSATAEEAPPLAETATAPHKTLAGPKAKPPQNGDDPGATAPTKAQATVRVDLERVDRLVNLVGELVINQAMLSQSVAEAGLASNQNVSAGLDEFMQLTRDIQDSVMMIRAQPVKSLFQRMARIVREAAGNLEKDVRLLTEGETTEVDKTVIERLADPLTHMIRNAVDHGLETTQERLAAGKPAEGIVSLSAAHRSGRVVIEVSDDGGGINRDKVFQIAVSKGLVPGSAQLSDGEIDNLLFLPGFSTATEVSNLSGRGVGMDVVRTAISALGGRISITSKPGYGTTFSISLPLTLAVQDGMVVRVAEQTIVIPLNHIVETLTLTQNDIRALGPNTSVLQVRDKFVPLLDLAAELGYRPPKGNYDGCIALMIAQEEEKAAALVVDTIIEQRQVVIKGLQESYGNIPGIAAATILGDGQIALILDASDVVASASGQTRNQDSHLSLAG